MYEQEKDAKALFRRAHVGKGAAKLKEVCKEKQHYRRSGPRKPLEGAFE